MTVVLFPHHKWLSGVRGSSLVLEYLLDKEFGTNVGTEANKDIIAAEKIVKAQKMINEQKLKRLKNE